MKKLIMPLLIIWMLFLAACTGVVAAPLELVSSGDTATAPVEAAATPEVDYAPEDLTASNTTADVTIQLNGQTATLEGEGATVDGATVTITTAGIYQISGTLSDGQIIVDALSSDLVTLVLAGVDITSSTSAPLFVANADKVVITLEEGSENVLTDGDNYLVFDESGEPNAALFSMDDLTINGTGVLTVNANYNNGIASKDDLKITDGTIVVNAVNDGIKGKDSVVILDGVITINAAADGIQATNGDEAENGYVAIEGGSVTIVSGLDGVQAETSLLVTGGALDITAGGGSVPSTSSDPERRVETNPNQTEESVKGLKAGLDLTISGGDITISALDDALHSDSTLTINAGNLEIVSGDDAVHADNTLTINGGTLNITESYEGLESQIITLNDGNVHLVSSDDGINATDGGGSETSGPGVEFGDNYVYINGGYLYIDAGGDGLDSNGNFAMTDGVVLVNGPTTDFEGPLDYGISFQITGGFLVAVGSAGMAPSPSTDSTQYGVLHIFDTVQSAGTLIHIETADDEEILTFQPAKDYQSIVISSPELENGETYVVYTGGSSSGTSVDGLITGGDYTPGRQAASFTITSIITGESSGGGMGDRQRP
jgi:hypothetical protein